MKIAILDAYADNPGDLSWEGFEKLAETTIYPRTQQEELIPRAKDCQAILINKLQITEKVLENLPLLKYIGVCATGYNVVDIDACCNRGITVTNVPAYSTDAVAQHVFSFITYFSNHVALLNESVHKGEWKTSPDFVYWKKPLIELSGKTLGIFGYGNIGHKVCEIGKAFGMNVICHTRTKKADMPEYVSFEDLLKRSDFITLHAPLTPQTEKIINKESLLLMKKSAFLINTARGGLVEESDLAQVLKAGGIAGYAADVISVEPMLESNVLCGCPNCVLTPHVAWAPLETRARLLDVCLENFKAWLSGNPQNVVNK